MEPLKEQITIISAEECQLLKADKLAKKRRNRTGFYLVCGADGKYTACDYSERQNWAEYFGESKDLPKGWVKEFDNPLDAIDWLFETK